MALAPDRFDYSPITERPLIKWPGNARELRNAVERMAILSHDDVLSAAAIPLELRLPQRDNGARSSVKHSWKRHKKSLASEAGSSMSRPVS